MRRKSTDQEVPEFMNKKKVANYLGVSTKTVERMMNEGLQSIRLRGRRYFTKHQLQDYIDRNSKTA